MTRDDIIRMAREAGWAISDDVNPDWLRRMEIFAKMAYEAGAAAEREACAQVCEDMDLRNNALRPEYRRGLSNAARTIRARGEK